MTKNTTGLRARNAVAALAALAAVAIAMLLAPGAAHAATYAVDACQHQDGSPVGYDGWSAQWGGQYVYYGETCNNGGGMDAWWDAGLPHSDGNYAAWRFQAPPGTTLSSLTAYRYASIGPDQAYGSPTANVRTDQALLAVCAIPYGCGGWSGQTVSYGLGGASWVQYDVYCSGSNGCKSGGSTSIGMRRIQIALEDDTGPVLNGAPSGSLMSSSTTARSRSLSYSASDTGGGIYRQRLLADGTQVAAATVDDNAGKCATYAGAFSYRVPCKASASATIGLDTAQLSDGSHELTLEVYDATNQNKTTYGPWPVSVDNQPPVIGTVSLSGTATVGQQLTCSANVSGQNPTTSYAWSRANSDGSAETTISGATGKTYTLQQGDQGRKVLCEVTGTDNGGSASAKSTLTTPPFDNGATVAAAPAPTPPADACPQQPTGTGTAASEDFDGDGVPNCRDSDDDNDAIADSQDPEPFTPATTAAPSSSSGQASGGSTASGASTPAGPGGRAADNGVNAGRLVLVTAGFARGGRTTATVRYGRAQTIRGRVVNQANGLPVTGAIIDVSATPAAAGGAARAASSGVQTGSDGSFVVTLPAGQSSSTIQIAYRPNLGDTTRGGQAALVLKVHAGIVMRVLRRPGALVFSGRLLGGPFPSPGQLVEVQVRKGRVWQTFGRSVHATSRGRFVMTYPTAGVARHVAFTFRAVTRASAGYPYLGAASRPVRGMVR